MPNNDDNRKLPKDESIESSHLIPKHPSMNRSSLVRIPIYNQNSIKSTQIGPTSNPTNYNVPFHTFQKNNSNNSNVSKK